MIQFNNLTFAYKGNTDTVIFNEFTGELETNSISVILGSSGTGKTTLFKLICNQLKPNKDGQILINNMPPAQAIKHRHLAYLPQSFEPAHWLTVKENISLMQQFNGIRSQRRTANTSQIIKDLKLNDLENRKPHELSGGQQRRVSLAMLLSTEAKIFLLDEPLVNLDTQHKYEVYNFLLNDWRARTNSDSSKTTFLITHDLDEAVLLGEKIHILKGSTPHKEFITKNNPIDVQRRTNDLEKLRYENDFKVFVEEIKNNL